MYIPKVTFHCGASTFRNICDDLKEFFTDELKFSADDVALLIGLPNTGDLIYWEAEPLTSYTGIQIKNEIKNINKSTSPEVIVNMYIKFLLSNLFFPNNNYRTPRRLITIVDNIDKFNSYNWAMSIQSFLVSQFNRLAPKFCFWSTHHFSNLHYLKLGLVSSTRIAIFSFWLYRYLRYSMILMINR
ncbi:hypothetical protein IEQ34_008762 [Dendrobium chrysotoxum]|uniref:Uncharacterized protein n=1 Tax=Dendrobium chrysotoxum TaxID=161865 RepID=A0AAV7GXI2_DENCH|nr:hypothetical protein IEQ34_008762 [Dendrobium chrysotoxum]